MNESKKDVPQDLYNYDYVHHVCDKKEIIKDQLDISVVDIEKEVRKVKRKRLKRESFNYGYFVLALIFFVSIGFAYLFTNLEVLSSFGTKATNWKIKFENIEVVEDQAAVDGIEPVIMDDTTIRFSANLLKPGDTYSFTFDAVNEGTINAMVGEHSIVERDGELARNLPSFLQYKLEYVDYDEEVETNQLLPKKDRKKLKFTIKYKEVIEEADLKPGDFDFDFTFKLEYKLADKDVAIEVE